MNDERLVVNVDCRHYRGEKPCRYARLCAGCPHYATMGARILIVKLDAIGDVARTTPLLAALRAAHDPVHIAWLVAPAAAGLLRDHPRIDVVLPYGAESLEGLRAQRFDLVLSLDKTPRAAAAAMNVRAARKLGFGLSEKGAPYPLNPGADYAFLLGLSDEVKFKQNRRTYQDVIFECCEMRFAGEDYDLPSRPEDAAFAEAFRRRAGFGEDETVIGIHCGGGAAFANKMWAAPECIEFIRLARARTGARVLLFGAAREHETLATIAGALGDEVVLTGEDNTLGRFQALLGLCDVVVTGDSLGMHLALAVKRRAVVLFGPTCAAEIELYGRGEKVVSLAECVPCYRPRCERTATCMQAIPREEVLAAVMRQLAER